MAAPQRTRFRGLPAWRLAGPGGASALVLEHGAQVVSWIAGGTEQLFVAAQARCADGHHLRGGMPVSFPQFDRLGDLPRHGFARLRSWAPEIAADGDAAAASFVLRDDERTRAAWPFAFGLRLSVRLEAAALDVGLEVANPGAQAFAFTAAFHTYLACAGVLDAQVLGLQGLTYLDNLTGANARDDAPAWRLRERTGRIYARPDGPVTLVEGARRVEVAADGFEDVVLWNPHEAGSAVLDDLEPQGWRRMLCIEAAQARRAAVVAPGGRWAGRQRLVLASQRGD